MNQKMMHASSLVEEQKNLKGNSALAIGMHLSNFYSFVEFKKTTWLNTPSVSMIRSIIRQRRSDSIEQLVSSCAELMEFCSKTFLLSCTRGTTTSRRKSSCRYKTTPMAGTESCKCSFTLTYPIFYSTTTCGIYLDDHKIVLKAECDEGEDEIALHFAKICTSFKM